MPSALHFTRDPSFPTSQRTAPRSRCVDITDMSVEFSCAVCVQHFCGYQLAQKPQLLRRALITDAAAANLASSCAQQCKDDQKYLRAKLAQYGDVIHKRWKKKSKEKREALLKAAEPDLYEYKWILERFQNGQETREDQQRLLDTGVLLPWLNVEILRDEPVRLLSLLHIRATSELCDWVSHDVAQMETAFNAGILDFEINLHCLAMDGNDFGTLVPFNEELCHSWTILGFTRGLLVLQAQAYLLNLLRKTVDGILDPEPAATGNLESMAMTVSGSKIPGAAEQWSSFLNQAFSAPPTFDISNILSQVETQEKAAMDYLDSIQTNPPYVQRSVSAWRKEMYHDTSVIQSDAIFEVIGNDLLLASTITAQNMRLLARQCRHVQRIMDHHRDFCFPGLPWPTKVNASIAALHNLALSCYEADRRALGQIVHRSVGFAHNYEKAYDKAGRLGTILRPDRGACDQKDLLRADPLHWALTQLFAREPSWYSSEPAKRFGFIEDHLANSDQEERGRIGQRLYDQLSVMLVYWQIVAAISTSRPHPFEPEATEISDLKPEDYGPGVWEELGHKADGATEPELKQLGTALRHFCEHPWPKGRRDAKWLQEAEESRSRLRDFWAVARKCESRMLTRRGFPVENRERELDLIRVDLSPEYEEQVRAEREAVLKAIAAKEEAKIKRLTGAPVIAQSQWGEAADEKLTLPVGRIRPKTRPDKSLDQAIENIHITEAGGEDLTDDKPSTIQVNRESFGLFSKLFGDERTKGVKWQQFVSAMTDVGFTATHRGGSIVAFDPTALDSAMKPINFHKPHPEPTIDPVVLHYWANRLRRHYGWDLDTFVEREKK